MTISAHRETAKIYQFPIKARATASRNWDDKHSMDHRAVTSTGAIVASGWYHEEAIQDADRARKR